MHCYGKCIMFKKLNQEEKNQQNNPERKSDNKNELTLSSKSFFVIGQIPPAIINLQKIINQVSDITSAGCNLDIFHPPQA